MKGAKKIISLALIGAMMIIHSRPVLVTLVFFLFSIWYFPFVWEELNRK